MIELPAGLIPMDGQSHHLAVSYDEDGVQRIYVDGDLQC